MNIIEIRIDPYEEQNEIIIDGRKPSLNGTLSGFVKKSFLTWADDFFDAAFKENNDSFGLTVSAESFETRLLYVLAGQYEYCESFSEKAFEMNMPIKERLIKLTDLCERNGISYKAEFKKAHVYSNLPFQQTEFLIQEETPESAEIIVFSNEKELTKFDEYREGAVVFILSDKEEISCVAGDRYIWKIPLASLSEVLNGAIEYFAEIPSIKNLIAILENNKEKLSEDDRICLNNYSTTIGRINVRSIPQIEVGTSFTPSFVSSAGEVNETEITIESSNPGVITIDGKCLYASSEGEANIKFFRNKELIPFAVKRVSTYIDRTVKEIVLTPESNIMGVNQTQLIGIKYVPADAEDKDTVEWTVDFDETATVDQTGVITSLQSGIVTVCAQTANAIARAEIEVQPDIESLTITPKEIDIYMDAADQHFEVTVSPANCYDGTYTWSSSNPNVMVIDDNNNGIIKGIGECTLTCKANASPCSDTCTVRIKSTLDRGENPWLSYTAVGLVITIITLFFSYPYLTLVVGVATAALGIISMIKKKRDLFWSAVLIIIAAGLVFWRCSPMFM